MIVLSKICTGCSLDLPIENYDVTVRRGQEYVRPRCRSCTRVYANAQYHIRHKAGQTQSSSARLRKYGWDSVTVQLVLKSQNGLCKICKTLLAERFHIDHSHSTGRPRGILCHRCNVGLSYIEDVEFKQAAEKYLKDSEGKGDDERL